MERFHGFQAFKQRSGGENSKRQSDPLLPRNLLQPIFVRMNCKVNVSWFAAIVDRFRPMLLFLKRNTGNIAIKRLRDVRDFENRLERADKNSIASDAIVNPPF